MESNAKVSIHPVALFSIVDAFERRNDLKSRVVGTLLGYVDSLDIQVTNAFPVPLTEDNTNVYMSIEYNQRMLELNAKVSPNEKIVGWFSTGSEITDHSKLVHEDYYKKLSKKPCIFLLVDTSMQSLDMMIKAYISRPIGYPSKSNGVMFVPIDVRITSLESEIFALGLMKEGLSNKRRLVYMKDDMSQIIDDSTNVLNMITVVLKYVRGVLEKKIIPDPQVGRKLSQIILAIPKIDPDKLKELISASKADMLMYSYLCKLLEAEVKITEKSLNLN